MTGSDDNRINERFEQYVAAFRRGDGDPDPVMADLDRDSQLQLGRMIDDFLETGPLPDPEMMSPDNARVQAVVADLMPRLDGRAGALSRLLAERREALKLTQSEVVRDLAGSLEASDPETEKIEAYYHDLEWGTLSAAGLTSQLLDALAGILKTTREALRDAGQALGPARASSTGPVYARMVEEGGETHDIAIAGQMSPGFREATPPDRIDRLFTGG